MEPSLNTWTIIFLIAAVQGLFLSLMIFLRKSKINNILGTLILAFSLMLLYYVAYWTHYAQLLPTGIAAAQGLTYLLGPLTYSYISSDRKNFHFNSWHLAPFALYLVYFPGQFLTAAPYPMQVRTVQVIIQSFHLLIYTVLIFSYILQQNRNLQNGELKLFQWKKKIAYAFAGYSLSFLLYYVLVWTDTIKIEYDYMISIASSIFIYFIGYHGYQNPHLLKNHDEPKYGKSSLSPSAARSILSHLKEHMNNEKPYLDSTLKLQQLAEQLSLSAHHISQSINDLSGQNFSDFINQYRIHEAQSMLKDPNQSDKKIIHIALDTGFNNKATFNNAFKKFTGLSPSEYKNLHTSSVSESTFEVNR